MSATTTVPAKAAKSATPPPSDRAGALAADRAASFPIPSGREEAWRFTPLEPLRALLEGIPASGPEPSLDWTASGDAEVGVVPPRRPAGRIGARAGRPDLGRGGRARRRRAGRHGPGPGRGRGGRPGDRRRRYRLCLCADRHRRRRDGDGGPRPLRRRDHRRGRGDPRRRRGASDLRQRPGLGRRGGARQPPSHPRRPGRRVHLGRGHPGRRARAHHAHGQLRRPRRQRGSCWACTSPTPGSTWSTGFSSTTPSRTAAPA